MKVTTIEQHKDGGVSVRIAALTVNKVSGTIDKYTGSACNNYIAEQMGKDKLIPNDLIERAFDGWLFIKCETAIEAIEIMNRIETNVHNIETQIASERSARVMEYIRALIASGKSLYIQNEQKKFIKID